MNRFQKEVNNRTKYLMTIFCDRSFYKLRKRVRRDYKVWIEL